MKEINDILTKYGYTIYEVQSRQRNTRLVNCKVEIARMLRDKGYSYPVIGKVLNKDHTTIMHYIKKHKKI